MSFTRISRENRCRSAKLVRDRIPPASLGGTEYCLGRRENRPHTWRQLVDIPFPKTVRNELVKGGRAEPHHILPESGWVSIYLRQASDVDRAIELLRLSFEIANQRTAK